MTDMARMDFEEFKTAVTEGIRERLPEELTGLTISMDTMTKNNGTRYASIKVANRSANTVQHINLEDCFREYRNGTSLNQILQWIAEVCIKKGVLSPPGEKQLTDFAWCRDRIRPKLINTSMNQKLLERCPYVLVEDLAAVFYIDLGLSGDNQVTVPVRNGMAEEWGMDADSLYRLAVKNLAADGGTIMPITDVMAEMFPLEVLAEFGMDSEDVKAAMQVDPQISGDMFVLSNRNKLWGAAMILEPDVMEEAVRKLGDGFYAIPSSVHEFLAVPATIGLEVPELNAMIQDTNMTAVLPEERLSDHVYRYYSGTGLSLPD